MRRYFFFLLFLLLLRVNEGYFVCNGQFWMFNTFECGAAHSDDEVMRRHNNVDKLELVVNLGGSETWREYLKWDESRRVYHLPEGKEEIVPFETSENTIDRLYWGKVESFFDLAEQTFRIIANEPLLYHTEALSSQSTSVTSDELNSGIVEQVGCTHSTVYSVVEGKLGLSWNNDFHWFKFDSSPNKLAIAPSGRILYQQALSSSLYSIPPPTLAEMEAALRRTTIQHRGTTDFAREGENVRKIGAVSNCISNATEDLFFVWKEDDLQLFSFGSDGALQVQSIKDLLYNMADVSDITSSSIGELFAKTKNSTSECLITISKTASEYESTSECTEKPLGMTSEKLQVYGKYGSAIVAFDKEYNKADGGQSSVQYTLNGGCTWLSMATTTSVRDVASDRLNNHMAFLFSDGLVEIFTLGSKSTVKIDSSALGLKNIWWFETSQGETALYGLTASGEVRPLESVNSATCHRHIAFDGRHEYNIDKHYMINVTFTVRNTKKVTSIGRTARNSQNIILSKTKKLNHLDEIQFEFIIKTSIDTVKNTKTMLFLFLRDSIPGCGGQSIELLIDIACPEDYLELDYHSTLKPLMSHYWLNMFWEAPNNKTNDDKWGTKWDKYRDWDEAAREWGNGTDYLVELNRQFEDRKMQMLEEDKPLYPKIGNPRIRDNSSVMYSIPKNYRPPSKFAKAIPVNDHLYNSDLANCSTTNDTECIMNCMNNKFCRKIQKNISQWDDVRKNVNNWKWTGDNFERKKECRGKELFDMKRSNVECVANAISISRNSSSSNLCFKLHFASSLKGAKARVEEINNRTRGARAEFQVYSTDEILASASGEPQSLDCAFRISSKKSDFSVKPKPDTGDLYELNNLWLFIPKENYGLYHFRLTIEESFSFCPLSVEFGFYVEPYGHFAHSPGWQADESMMLTIVFVTIVAFVISLNFRRHTSALKDRKKMVLVDEEDSATSETLSDNSDKGYNVNPKFRVQDCTEELITTDLDDGRDRLSPTHSNRMMNMIRRRTKKQPMMIDEPTEDQFF